MTLYPLQDSMVRGEISPRLHGRPSLELYRSGLALCENFLTLPHGGIRKRGGTYFVQEVRHSNRLTRPIPFIFSEEQAYVLEFGHLYFRVYAYGARVGTVEVTTPWSEDDLADLQYVQSADVLWVTHPNYETRKITRTGHTSWSIAVWTVNDGPFQAQNFDESINCYVSAATGSGVTITASSSIFASSDVGKLFKIQMQSYEDIKPWEADQVLARDDGGTANPQGLIRRYNGNVYVCVEGGATGSSTAWTGVTPPTHLRGAEWDGPNEQVPDKGMVGVKWEYMHSGFGVARITGYTNGTTVTATVVSDFPDEMVGAPGSYMWSFGAFGGSDGYPRAIALYEERLMLGKKFSVFGSRTGIFDKFRTNDKDDDGLAFQVVATSDITWLTDTNGFLAVGTIGGLRSLTGGGNEDALTPSSFRNQGSPTKRCSSIRPTKAGNALVYVGYDRNSIVEAHYSLETNSFQTGSLSLMSEHIPKRGVKAIAYQEEPDPVIWVVLDTGELAGLTYEPDHNVRGWHRQVIGGRGIVEDIAVTPSMHGADDVWLIVRRTIGGQTKRYIEMLLPPFEYGDPEWAYLVDSGRVYEGPAANTFTGASHLNGANIVVYANGRIYRDIPVASGQFSLPNGETATILSAGFEYPAVAETLELDVGGRDGSLIGRKKKVSSVILSVLETANVYVKAADRKAGSFSLVKAKNQSIVPEGNSVSLYTGNFDPIPIEDTWEGRGRIRIEAPDPVPCTIRALTPAFDSEP